MDLQYILLTSHRPQYLLPQLKTPLKMRKQSINIKQQIASSSLYRLTSNQIIRGSTTSKSIQGVLRKTTTINPNYKADPNQLEKKQNMIGNYQIGKQIGKGGFAKVYQATDINTGNKYAIKQYLLQQSHQCFVNESNLGRLISINSNQTIKGYKSLIRFIQRLRIGKKGYIVQQLGGTSLSKMLYEIHGVFHENERVYQIVFKQFYRNLAKGNHLKNIFLQICQGVNILNQKGFIHCDLKSQNILVSLQNQQPSAKVIDFGSTFQLEKGIPKITITPEYMPPQLLTILNMTSKQEQFSNLQKVDVWSLGCILLEILTGLPLWFKYKCKLTIKGKISLQLGYFSLANRDYNKIIKKQKQISSNIHKILFTFEQFEKFRPVLKRCLEFDSNRRININQLVQLVQNI